LTIAGVAVNKLKAQPQSAPGTRDGDLKLNSLPFMFSNPKSKKTGGHYGRRQPGAN